MSARIPIEQVVNGTHWLRPAYPNEIYFVQYINGDQFCLMHGPSRAIHGGTVINAITTHECRNVLNSKAEIHIILESWGAQRVDRILVAVNDPKRLKYSPGHLVDVEDTAESPK